MPFRNQKLHCCNILNTQMQQSKLLVATNHETMQQKKSCHLQPFTVGVTTLHSDTIVTFLQHRSVLKCNIPGQRLQHPRTTVATSQIGRPGASITACTYVRKRASASDTVETSPDNGCNILGQWLQHPSDTIATSPDNGLTRR